jgi:hemin uptake protein HemP
MRGLGKLIGACLWPGDRPDDSEMQTSTFKTSTIFVATGKRTRVFQSMDDVPTGVRKRMSEHLSGPNTRTLIVADRRGREYLLRVLQRATSSTTLKSCEPISKPSAARRFTDLWFTAKRYWLEVALIGLLGAAGWALVYSH